MHVDIHRFICNFHMQGTNRELPDHHPFPAGRLHRVGEQRAFHHALVDEEIFLGTVAARHIPDADKAFHDHAAADPFDRCQHAQDVQPVFLQDLRDMLLATIGGDHHGDSKMV